MILFIAANDQAAITSIRAQNPTKLVKDMNTRLIQQARTFVWGTNDSQLTYVRKHFGRLPDRVILTDEQKKQAIDAINVGEDALDDLIAASSAGTAMRPHGPDAPSPG
jgi:hypothetical protein